MCVKNLPVFAKAITVQCGVLCLTGKVRPSRIDPAARSAVRRGHRHRSSTGTLLYALASKNRPLPVARRLPAEVDSRTCMAAAAPTRSRYWRLCSSRRIDLRSSRALSSFLLREMSSPPSACRREEAARIWPRLFWVSQVGAAHLSRVNCIGKQVRVRFK